MSRYIIEGYRRALTELRSARVPAEVGVEPGVEGIEPRVEAIDPAVESRAEAVDPGVQRIAESVDPCVQRVTKGVETTRKRVDAPSDGIDPSAERIDPAPERVDPRSEVEQRPQRSRCEEPDRRPDGCIHPFERSIRPFRDRDRRHVSDAERRGQPPSGLGMLITTFCGTWPLPLLYSLS